VRIVQRGDGVRADEHGKMFRYPFAEVFIVTEDGREYYTRLFHTLANDSHARAAQAQDFLKRMAFRDRCFA
jgi:hypothetical protein